MQTRSAMVNYKRVICEVALIIGVVSMVSTAPAPAPDCPHAHGLIDQRQNGTENYRLSIDGVVIAVAPAETLLDAASDISDFFDESDLEVLLKPPKPQNSSKPENWNSEAIESKPQPEKPSETPLSDVSLTSNSDIPAQKKDVSAKKQEKTQRLKQRLANVLIPLLRRTRQH